MVDRLLASQEPSVRLRTLVGVLGRDPASEEVARAREAVRTSPRVRTLLCLRGRDGRIPGSPYAKWTGAHWVLAALADLGYPSGDRDLLPLKEQVYEMWLSPEHTCERVVEREASSWKSRPGVPVIQGRPRRCASQEGNALYATLALGIADGRADELAANLVRWQWPDGGWNCDRRAEASHSSFDESLIPLRGLGLHATLTGSPDSRAATARAAELFLARKLHRRLRDGRVIKEEFVRLHYPPYGHYDILFGLEVMAQVGLICDDRCAEALDLLESKRLDDGGFPAERKLYRVVEAASHGGSLVDWGGTSRKRSNEFVTAEALSVLVAAGRLGFA